jgi:hypothetical protein
MTKVQLKKLETLIGKLEALQHEVKDEKGLLMTAKEDLMRFRKEAA